MTALRARTRVLTAVGGVAVVFAGGVSASAAPAPFLGPLHMVRKLASTVPANGDVNPYGVAVVQRTVGRLHRGDVLISNFNAKSNLQGTGTTIVEISPSGHRSLFARISAGHLPGPCPGGVGLTTALSVLPSGWVIVGSLPTKNGTARTAKAGCLLVLGSHGMVRETIANPRIDGPWDMTAVANGRHTDLFVTNVLHGTVAAHGAVVHRGTVVRIAIKASRTGMPKASRPVVIGSRFAEHSDPAALVVGPTGVAFSRMSGKLYVADTATNRIAAIPRALTRTRPVRMGRTVTKGGRLSSPLGLVTAPNGNLLSVNAGNGLIVETTPRGMQVANRVLDSSGTPPGAGTLFGLAIAPRHHLYFVDDGTNTLNLLR
jgi:hypothetical protein